MARIRIELGSGKIVERMAEFIDYTETNGKKETIAVSCGKMYKRRPAFDDETQIRPLWGRA